jgi:hypothetical protein
MVSSTGGVCAAPANHNVEARQIGCYGQGRYEGGASAPTRHPPSPRPYVKMRGHIQYLKEVLSSGQRFVEISSAFDASQGV